MSQQIDLIFGVAGGGKLGGVSGRKIQSQINNIVKQINTTPKTIVFEANTAALDKVETQLKSIRTLIATMPELNVGKDLTDDLTKAYGQIKGAYGKFLGNEVKFDSIDKSLPAAREAVSLHERLVELSKSFVDNDGVIYQKTSFDDDTLAKAEEFSRVQETYNKKLSDADKATKKLAQTNKQNTTELMNGQVMLNKLYKSYDSFKNIKDYPDLIKKFENIKTNIKSAKKDDKGNLLISSEEVKRLKKDINEFENACYEAGVQVDTFGQAIEHKIGDRVKYLIGQFAIDFVTRGLRMIYDNVVQIDTAMTELKKVTNETDEAYKRFLTNAGDRAKELGATLVEVVQVTSDYARLGYSVDEASELADTAIIYKNVADGISTTDEATDHIISTMKAFGIEAANAMTIVDAFNEVSNNFAVTSSDIGAGLQRSSAAMAAAGNSMEETIALFTAGNTIIRDADTMGTSLKTISMRLRSTKSDLEAMGEDTDGAAESVSSLRKELLALTGVDIQLDENTYKNTYEILQELSKIWDNLDDLTQANVLEKLFGKRQANVGAAILENFNIAEESLETAMNSAGSAVSENEKYLESIRGHLDQLTASFQTLSTNVLDSELVKFGVDVLRLIVDLLNEIFVLSHGLGDALKEISPLLGEIVNLIGTLTVMAGGASLIDGLFGFKHVKDVLNYIKAAKEYLTILKMVKQEQAKADILSAAANATKKYTDATMMSASKTVDFFKKILSFIKVNPVLTALMAIYAVIVAIGVEAANAAKIENQLADIQEAKDKYEGLQSEVNQLNEELKTTQSRITELESKGSLTVVEQEELNKLRYENELLQAQLEYKKDLAAFEQKEITKETQDAFYNTFGYRKVDTLFGSKYIESGTYGDSKGPGQSAYLDSYKEIVSDIKKYEQDIQSLISEREKTIAEAEKTGLGEATVSAIRSDYDKKIEALEDSKVEAEKLEAEMLVNLFQWRNDLSGAADAASQAIVKAIDTVIYGIANGMDTAMINLLGDSRFEEIFEFLKGKDENISESLIKGVFGESLGQEFINALSAAGYSIHEVTEAVNELESESPVEVEFAVSTEELDAAKESVKSLSSSCKTLADAFKEQNENGSLSVDTILDVIDAGYGAALAVDAETGAVTLNADMYLVLAQAELAATKLKWLDIRASYEQQYAQAQEAMSTGELGEAYKDLAEAELAALTAKGHLAEVDAILKSIDSIDLSNVTAGIYGIGDAASSAKSQLSNLQSGMENLLSQTISWLKDEYSRAQDAQENYYESQIDALEEAKDAAKERWDAEKEALEDAKDSYNDLIDAQIELLKRQKDADDYAKNREEKEEAISDIENQLLAIEGDDSIEAQKMRLELEEQLKEAQEELEELQSDREYELREQALQDEKDRYNDEVDAKLEAIDKQSEAEEKAYQDRIDRLQDYLDAVRNAVRTEADWRAEAYDWINNNSDELYQKLIEWNRIYGDGLDSTIDKLFAEADGWKLWGDTFEEARENLARYLNSLEDGAGTVAQKTTTLLEDLLKGLDEYQQKLIEENNNAEAKMVENLINNISSAVRHGMEFSEEMLKAMHDAVLSGDKECLEATNRMLGYYNDVMLTGRTNFGAMEAFFRQAMLQMDEDACIILQGIYDNINTVAKAAYDMNKLIENGWTHNDSTGWTSADGTMSEFDQGGVVDYTGPAAVHGSKSHPEVVFNADAAAKLYDYVVNTPNLLKSAFDSIMVESPKLRADPIGMNPTVGDININISGNADADTVNSFRKIAGQIREEVVRSLNESMSRRGIARSPRMV